MANFVFDGEALPGTKVNSRPLLGPANTIVPASEFNEVTKALADIRTVLLTLLDPTVLNALATMIAVSPLGRVYFKFNVPETPGNFVYAFANPAGVFQVSGNPPP